MSNYKNSILNYAQKLALNMQIVKYFVLKEFPYVTTCIVYHDTWEYTKKGNRVPADSGDITQTCSQFQVELIFHREDPFLER